MKAIKVDSACRVRLSALKPGDCYQVEMPDGRTDRITLKRLEAAAAAPDLNTFEGGVRCMARNTLAAVELLKRGEWNAKDLERWLKAVIGNDEKFLKEVQAQLAWHLSKEPAGKLGS